MLQPRIWASTRTIFPCLSLSNCSTPLITSLSQRPILHLPSSLKTSPPNTRPASHASQGRANKAAPGPGKRLGAKKSDSELVVPGNIIFRQRGTHWFPGENCGMGRDHTIFALEKGYVRYYRDPDKHKDRKYIGIVFDRQWSLPRGRGAARRRRLGLEARDMSTEAIGAEPIGGAFAEAMAEQEGNEGSNEVQTASADMATGAGAKTSEPKPKLALKQGYMYRESNWQIGRAAEKANVKVREYKPGDRFLAWRKANARKARNAERRGLRRK